MLKRRAQVAKSENLDAIGFSTLIHLSFFRFFLVWKYLMSTEMRTFALCPSAAEERKPSKQFIDHFHSLSFADIKNRKRKVKKVKSKKKKCGPKHFLLLRVCKNCPREKTEIRKWNISERNHSLEPILQKGNGINEQAVTVGRRFSEKSVAIQCQTKIELNWPRTAGMNN